MREYLLIFTLLTLGGYAAEAPDVDPAWPRDRDCFKLQTIYFRPGSSLLSTEAKQKIAEVANFLKAHPSTALAIEGHCDDRGSEEHNRWLGDRRARAAAKELVGCGIAPDCVDTISFGEDRPADTGHDAKARMKNRRAEFVLLRPPVPIDPSAHNQTLHSTPR
jgi:peptidoglycan-associated lipoprotein